MLFTRLSAVVGPSTVSVSERRFLVSFYCHVLLLLYYRSTLGPNALAAPQILDLIPLKFPGASRGCASKTPKLAEEITVVSKLKNVAIKCWVDWEHKVEPAPHSPIPKFQSTGPIWRFNLSSHIGLPTNT